MVRLAILTKNTCYALVGRAAEKQNSSTFGKEQYCAAVGISFIPPNVPNPSEFLTALKGTTQPFLCLKI